MLAGGLQNHGHRGVDEGLRVQAETSSHHPGPRTGPLGAPICSTDPSLHRLDNYLLVCGFHGPSHIRESTNEHCGLNSITSQIRVTEPTPSSWFYICSSVSGHSGDWIHLL